MSRFVIALCLIALGTAAKASEVPLCRNGLFPKQDVTFGLATVTASPRAYLRSDMAPCPDDGAACRQGRPYVIRGDTVITGSTSGEFVCAFFPGPNGGSAGYLRADEIAPAPSPTTPPLPAWFGTWRDGDNSIVLRGDGMKLAAEGEAYWPSVNPSPQERPGGPNLGEMAGSAIPTGNRVVFGGNSPDVCRVTLTLLPPVLLAADNMNCGGMNVSFTGVYRKR